MITHLFLDAGNTLVYPNFGVISQALAKRGVNLSPDELQRGEHLARRVVDDPKLIGGSNDKTRWKIHFETILRECGVVRPDIIDPVLGELRDYHARNNIWEVVPDGVREALDRLHRRWSLAVISNSNGTVREKLRRVGLLDYFKLVVDSHEEGVEKPDPRLFRIALERAGAEAEASLYVGDLYHVDVIGARAAGMHAALIDPAGIHADKPVRRIPDLMALLD